MMTSKPVTKLPAAITEQLSAAVPSKSFVTLNPAFSPDPTACPCCHQMTLESAFQMSLTPTGQGYTLMHCTNPDCAGYALTLKRETFLQQMTQIAQGADSDD